MLVLCLLSTQLQAAVRFELSHTTRKQGDPFYVWVHSDEPIKSGTVRFNGKTYTLFEREDWGSKQYLAYLGVSRYAPIKKHKLDLSLNLRNGTEFKTAAYLQVKDGGFKKEHITLSRKKEKREVIKKP